MLGASADTIHCSQPPCVFAANPRVFLCDFSKCKAEWDALMADPTLTLANE